MIEYALYLLAKDALDKTYYVRAPQGVTRPYTVMTRVSGVRLQTHDGATGLAQGRFQFSHYGDSYLDCKTAAQSLREVLDGYKGTKNDVKIGAVFCLNESDGYDDELSCNYVDVDYMVHYYEQKEEE